MGLFLLCLTCSFSKWRTRMERLLHLPDVSFDQLVDLINEHMGWCGIIIAGIYLLIFFIYGLIKNRREFIGAIRRMRAEDGVVRIKVLAKHARGWIAVPLVVIALGLLVGMWRVSMCRPPVYYCQNQHDEFCVDFDCSGIIVWDDKSVDNVNWSMSFLNGFGHVTMTVQLLIVPMAALALLLWMISLGFYTIGWFGALCCRLTVPPRHWLWVQVRKIPIRW